MSRIVWQPSFNLGIASIDNQHRKIIGIINALDDVLSGEASRTRVGNLLEELVDYTKTHFWDEEELLRRNGFPEIEEHLGEHREFVTRTKDFIRRFLDGDSGVAEEMCQYLCDWFVNHICNVDMKYRDLLLERGAG